MDTPLHLLSRYHRHGDADAFCELVRDHGAMVFATAKRVTRDSALAEDVAQETFLELARSGHGTVEAVGAWLHRVAWRKACNTIRSESRRRSHEQAAAVVLHDAPDATWEELEPLIDEAIEALPAHLREFLVLHYLEGRTQQELASRLGVNQSTVSRQLDAAIHELRARLRMKGVFGCAGLTVLLSSQTATAAPASLSASLGKISISGLGTNAVSHPGLAITTPVIAMTLTTKVLIAVATIAVISIPFVAHRPPTPLPDVAMAPLKPRPARQEKTVTTTKAGESDRPHYRPAPASFEVQQKVDDIIRRYRGVTKEELQGNPELNKLMNRFIAVMNAPAMQEKMNQRLMDMHRVKGAEGGMLRMDFDMLDDAHGRAWLEAAVADDSQRIEDWILNTLDDAVFEFAFDPAMEKTSNGVSFQPRPPAKAAAVTDPKQNE